MTTDELYMQRCLDLAAGGRGQVAPNPMVGCVVVCDGKIIGEGFHECYGEAHAEVNAIGSVADKTLFEKSTLYVNLEPCSHWGKTPPCSELIIRNGVKRVVVGMVDPFEKVSGRGIAQLRDAGIEVETGVLESECRRLNRRFVVRNTKKRPYIVLKWAQTSDGYLDNNRDAATPPTWMTGAECRLLVHRMRSECDAITVGCNTIERDNPSLTVRECDGKNPLRVVVDRTLRLSPNCKVFDGEAETLLITTEKNITTAKKKYINCEVAEINFEEDFEKNMLKILYERGIESLFIEGGGRVLEKYIHMGLWDEAHVFVSPLFVSELKGGTDTQPKGIKAPKISAIPIEKSKIDKVEYSIYHNKKNKE